MTPLNRLLFMYGTPTYTARAMGIKNRQTIEGWIKQGYIPYKCATMVQNKTGGAIRNIDIWLEADRVRGVK